MERLELELAPRGRIRRVYSFVVDALVLLVILVLMIDGWIAYRTFRTDPPSPERRLDPSSTAPTSSCSPITAECT
jgi:hypothetical protein